VIEGKDVSTIGKYLIALKEESKKRMKQSKSSDKCGYGHIGVNAESTFTSRLPPAPKKTTFGDFIGW
jgi:hypothetical protein